MIDIITYHDALSACAKVVNNSILDNFTRGIDSPYPTETTVALAAFMALAFKVNGVAASGEITSLANDMLMR